MSARASSVSASAAQRSAGARVETLVLTRTEVERCLEPEACRAAVARAFEQLGRGTAQPPKALGMDVSEGTFHAKAALHTAERPRFVVKINGNFPGNPAARGLPTIQGVLLLADAADGRPLALMDSGSVTAIRTAAASAVAIERLARPAATTLAIIGCGLQGRAHVLALLPLRAFRELRLHDAQEERAQELQREVAEGAGITIHVARSAADAARGAHVIVTCTTGAAFVLESADVGAGAVVAAVGADHPRKREIHPSLMQGAHVVVDDLAQCAASGDLRHAIEAGAMTAGDVHGPLAAIVAGIRAGRSSDDERFVFDSTGIALEDVAAADVAYERALALGLGQRVRFGA